MISAAPRVIAAARDVGLDSELVQMATSPRVASAVDIGQTYDVDYEA